MPSKYDNSRQRRADHLVNTFLQFHATRLRQVRIRQRVARKRLYKHATPASNTSTVSTSSDSDTTTTSSASTSRNSLISQSSSEASSTSSSHGSDNRGSESDSDYVGSDFFQQVLEDVELDIIVREVSLMASSAALEVELTVGFDVEEMSDSESGMMGSDADDEESEEEDMDLDDWDMDMATGGARSDRNRTRRVRLCVQQELSAMYAHRYTIPRKIHVKAPPQLPFILTHSKLHQLKDFRQCLRVSPYTFDRLVERIQNDTIFTNHSSNGQMPVADQLAIALYRFGHYGNAAGLDAVRRWAGVGKGTVVLVTKRVLAALLRSDMLAENLCMPTEEEREEAKAWVERRSCPAWRNGWCLVDGTLVPLFNRPYWYGESYFDRKCNYSLNFQIVSLPNLCIIDVGYGYTGSTHDATAWEMTRIKQLIATLVRCGEWVWADSAYPISEKVVAPYKRPEKDLPQNEVFNHQVSMIRIRSEHAIGFLKGRFSSLKDLRISITDESSHKLATYWGLGCVVTHNFAMTCEAEERYAEGDYSEDPIMRDPFLAEGIEHDESENPLGEGVAECVRESWTERRQRLSKGRQKREDLKDALFDWKDTSDRSRQVRYLREFGVDV
ncbi:hypothetical protein D9758_013848 [Tetrapyrgos nigripes]|uniref:DDE Tnp4 domain-containing protein n=1 Tax=Tetrapyrgos nigripes TaxID=182062 RepID=A0A8H5FRD8_9AGAR|nr:hypothetical protein D9758_013848 [Tetrapyrgos nigripes]